MTKPGQDALEARAHILEKQAIEACNATNSPSANFSQVEYDIQRRRRAGEKVSIPDFSVDTNAIDEQWRLAEAALAELGPLKDQAERYAAATREAFEAAEQEWVEASAIHPAPDDWQPKMKIWMRLKWETRDADYFAYRVLCTFNHASRYLEAIEQLRTYVTAKIEGLTVSN